MYNCSLKQKDKVSKPFRTCGILVQQKELAASLFIIINQTQWTVTLDLSYKWGNPILGFRTNFLTNHNEDGP